MKMKKKFLVLLFLVISFVVVTLSLSDYEVDAATSYYSSISDSAYGTTLKSSLRTLISKQTYYSTYDDCKDPAIVKKTDGNSSSTKIVLFWSGLNVAAAWDGGETWNREHVWPQSKGWFTTSGAGSDLHHIRPVDKSVNSSHNNNPYGIVSTNSYCHTGTINGSITIDAKCSNGVFEPGDSKKGDTARIIFYLLVRYSESDSYAITNVATSMDLLLEWNREDPVDASEQRRNEAVYGIQGNRNPFIDDSFYADLIWGGAKPGDNTGSSSGSGSGTSTSPNIPSTGKVATFEFGANSTTSSDTDSSTALTTYSETSNNYTLTLNNLSKVYSGYDASGNSCLKLGTASVVGTLSFSVPTDVDQVLILVTGYKSNTASITVNGATKTITTLSANSEYTNLTVDTSSTKSISFTTNTSGYRCKINTIVFYDLDNSGSSSGNESGGNTGENIPVTDIETAISSFESSSTKTSLILSYDYSTYAYSTPGSYSYTFTSQVYSSASAKVLNGVTWDPETTLLKSSGTKYYGYESTRGHQFGSASNPFKEVIIKTTDNILDGVTSVSIYASGASGTDAQVTAYVGGEKIGTTKSLTSSNKLYTFTSSTGMRGNIKFRITQTTSTAIYIKGMSMKYSGTTSYYDEYTLKTAGIRFGSYITKEIYDLLNESGTKWGVEYAGGSISDWSSSNVKTIYCTPAQVATPNATTTSSNGNYYQWALVVNGLTYTHLDKMISARVFVEYDGVKYYMSATTQSLRTMASSYLSLGSSEYSSHTGILNHIKNY